ncbi:MAG TPA: enolase C-terminal domain-like protein [Acidobacteriaceae bacterium]
MNHTEARIEQVAVAAYTVPTDAPEADGTLAWNSTTIVLVYVHAAGSSGLGYTYGNAATAEVAERLGKKCLLRKSAFQIPELHESLLRELRNDGSRGIGALAISALDVALWDLKARLLGCSVSDLIGRAEPSVAVYGSGGFTSYSDEQLTKQFSEWAASGIGMVKMKVGSNASDDPRRAQVARKAIGDHVALFVDANGAYAAKQAFALADRFAECGVTWFEEPVSSDDLAGLRSVRDAVSAPMEVAAGEYGYDTLYFRRMLEAGAVDVLQLDATRCGGFTGFLEAAAVARSFGCPLSAHCAPSLHMHAGCAIPGFRHVEYFHDHIRIERMLFDGFIPAHDGRLMPDRSAPGLGLTFKRQDAQRYAA